MTDFEKRLEEKRKAFEADQAERARAAEESRRNAESVTEEGVELLRQHAIPALQAAQRDLQKNGMDLLIEEEFDVTHFAYPVPKVSATCGSPARKRDGYRMESRPLIVEVKEGSFSIGIGKESNRRFIEKNIAQVAPEDARDVIEDLILQLADEVLKKVEGFEGSWS
ncbi:hypothetical protein J4E08_08965 [Sagittula sp. NFXS13]|uniref:hypothetical protein n=1 Tax=Sagittula sp. NFXS13 TaxID=2819095 RepID=UPI0032DFFEFF